jgi:small subunit ribosomal protein S2
MKIPSIIQMLQAGVHFGHQVSRWHPKMEEYIFTDRNGVHVIDLEKTRKELEKTLEAARAMAADGKRILFITTKPQAREIVKSAAIECGMPYLTERWIGGLLTNFPEMKKLFKKYLSLKEQQSSGELEKYTKHEQVKITKELEKMEKNLAGIAYLEKMPDALFVPALQREKTAVNEANRMNVPIVGVCDTNANPDKAEHIIPANDDAINAIKLIVGLVAEVIKEGREEYEKKSAAIKVKEEKERKEIKPTFAKSMTDKKEKKKGKEKLKRGLDWN